MDWFKIGGVIAFVAVVAWGHRDALKKLLGKAVDVVNPVVTPGAVDGTLARVAKWQELVTLCEGDCPEAVKLLNELWPHLRSGHVHEVTK